MTEDHDRYLGMDRPITRRDFINGAAVIVAGSLLTGTRLSGRSSETKQPGQADDYPPELTGLRGSHPGSFETAHSLRDGTFWKTAPAPTDTKEVYDLVVVGAGISGLAAAHFFREHAGKSSRILLLENHDDFGGHAKRNEFHLGGKLQLCNGGTLLIDSPTPYSPVADGLLKALGIDPPALSAACDKDELYPDLGMGRGVFFDKETFGEDRMVAGAPGRKAAGTAEEWTAFVARTPLSPAGR